MRAVVTVRPAPVRPRDVRLPPAVVRALAAPGQPLPTGVRRQMEQGIGHDFGHVRVHADARANAAADALQSLAFSSGPDIFFAAGSYRPGDRDGRWLLAHELVHTLQQGRAGGSGASRGPWSSDAGDAGDATSAPVRATAALEHEASAVATAVAAGMAVPAGAVSVAAPAARGWIARATRGTAPAPRRDLVRAEVRAAADEIARLLLFDPDDTSGRVRQLLARLDAETRDAVAGQARGRMTGAAAARLDAVVRTLRWPREDRSDLSPAPGRPVPADDADAAAREPAPDVTPDRPVEASAQAPRAGRADPLAGLRRLWRTTLGAWTGVPTPWAEPTQGERGDGEHQRARERSEEPAGDRLAGSPTTASSVPRPPESVERSESPPEQLAAAAVAGLREPQPGAEPGRAPGDDVRVPDAGGNGDGTAPAAGAVASGVAPAPSSTADQRGGEVVGSPSGVDENVAVEAPVGGPTSAPRTGSPADDEAPSTVEPQAVAEPAEPQVEAEPADAAAATEAETVAGTSTGAGGPVSAEAPPTTDGPGVDAAASWTETAASTAPGRGAEPAASDDPGHGAEPLSPETEDADEVGGGAAEGPGVALSRGPAPVPAEGGGVAPDRAAAAAGSAAAESVAAEPDVSGQAASESAATATVGPVELEPVAEVEPDADGAEAGAGGGADGGPSAAPMTEQPPAAPPEVAAGEPEAGLERVADLPPTAAAAALGGVRTASSNTVAAGRVALAAQPPELARPTGAPDRAEAVAEAGTAPVSSTVSATLRRAPARAHVPLPAPPPLPSAPPSPMAAVAPPQIVGATDAMTDADRATVRDSVRALPTTDPALDVTAGAPPTLELQGDADPGRADEQRAELDQATLAARTEGAAEAATPMGEAAVLPTVPAETLRAAVAAPSAPAARAAGESAGPPDPAVDAVVAERRPGELQGAARTALAGMATARQEHANSARSADGEARVDIEQTVARNAALQRTARDDLRRDVRSQRDQWTTAQADLVDTSQGEAGRARATLTHRVDAERERGATEAGRRITEGNRAAAAARAQAERTAREARSQAEAEPTGFLGWVASRARAFFESVRSAIRNAFENARRVVRQAIDSARRLAAGVIDTARRAVVAAIEAAGAALVAIGDRVLAGFPRLRARFRGAITAAVGAAQRVVDALAETLKRGVQAYLDLYARALDAALGVLETGLLAVVDGYAATVRGLIQGAQSVLNGLGDLLQVARDIASGPRQWVRNLGAAIVDGVRNHLWAALKSTVSTWFDTKVDAILGIGRTVWTVLARGGITVAAVTRLAFGALKKAIPVALVRLLITKLVALLVPAASAVMAIIEALQAAWGAAGTIIGALSKFVAFLKAVKGGNAGPAFAQAVAAAAVAVIEFVSFWLLRRLVRAAAAVGRAIKRVASKIAAMLRRLVQAIRRGLRRFTRRARAWMRRTARRFRRFRERIFGKRGKPKLTSAEKLARAQRELPPKITPLLEQGVTAAWLTIRLFGWRLQYRLGSLRVVRNRAAGTAKITATGSRPEVDIVRRIVDESGDRLLQMVREIADDLFKEPQVKKRATELAKQRIQGRLGRTEDKPIVTGPPGLVSHAGQALDLRQGRARGVFFHEVRTGGLSGVVREAQLGPVPGNIIVTLHPHRYVQMAADPARIFQSDRGLVGLARLNAVEGARAPSPLVLVPAAHALARATEAGTAGRDPRGHVTRPQALVGLNPAEPTGAGANLRELERRLGRPDPGGSRRQVDEAIIALQIRREKDLLIALTYQKMAIAGLLTTSEQVVRRFIDKELRNALHSAAVEGMVSLL